ncbi:TIGR04139 family peptide modification target [Chryseobacterium sp.]|uniref:TIGR04139 family peptide modification target n=1 Tax=Chryseobacterium sp. TaxID=1871047 RepID=UPI00321BFE8B
MKKLTGMKRAFSSENKKLNRDELKSVNGGYAIKSNLVNSEGCGETDYYSGPNGTGEYISRGWLCAG